MAISGNPASRHEVQNVGVSFIWTRSQEYTCVTGRKVIWNLISLVVASMCSGELILQFESSSTQRRTAPWIPPQVNRGYKRGLHEHVDKRFTLNVSPSDAPWSTRLLSAPGTRWFKMSLRIVQPASSVPSSRVLSTFFPEFGDALDH